MAKAPAKPLTKAQLLATLADKTELTKKQIDDVLGNLQAGGHDPNRNGFTVQNVELSFNAAVDPYFNAQVNVVYFTDRDGESEFELEEAFAESTSLPSGLESAARQVA